MRFGTNSRKGSSSVIIVMVVVVIALAGTAIYAALDNTVMAKDGYAMPGSTVTYSGSDVESPGLIGEEHLTIFGYSDGLYVVSDDGKTVSAMTIASVDEVQTDPYVHIEESTGKIDVPGLGKTKCVTSMIYCDYPDIKFNVAITKILNGLLYSIEYDFPDGEQPGSSLTISDSDISVGEYSTASGSKILSNTTNNITITVENECVSIDGLYLYKISRSDENTNGFTPEYYIGDQNMVPAFAGTGANSFSTGSATINFNSNAITSIYWNGTYT